MYLFLLTSIIQIYDKRTKKWIAITDPAESFCCNLIT